MATEDKINDLIHKPPNFVQESLKQLRYHVLIDGLKSDASGDCHYRNYVWTILLQVDLPPAEVYLELVSRGAGNSDAKIHNDTFRTLATDAAFKQKVSEQALTRVLNAYTVAHEGRAYVQGMNVIAAPFLYVSRSESQAFVLFNHFVSIRCPLYVTPTLTGVHTGLDLIDLVLEITDNALYQHLKSKLLTANLYAFASVMTFSASTPPLAEVLKLWDIMMAYGCHLNILMVVAQLLMMRPALLGTDKPMALLRSFPALNANQIKSLTLAILQKLPERVYDLVVRHPWDPSVAKELSEYRRKRRDL